MSHIAIRVENLSKKYVISHQRERGHKTLCDVITERLTAPWHSLASRLKDVGTANNGNGNTPSVPGSQLNSELRPPTLTSALAPREDFWALKDVCFEIKQGEVVGVIGGNGAGKSTLLKILSQITEPTKGRIEIDGRVASLLEVGTGFHPELTGRENIYLNGAILGMRRLEIKSKFDEIVDFAEIDKFLIPPLSVIPQRHVCPLAFAVAAHLEPEILIVDEVFAVGDAEFQKKCLGKMSEVAHCGRTVLFVSHIWPRSLRCVTAELFSIKDASSRRAVSAKRSITITIEEPQSMGFDKATGNSKPFQIVSVSVPSLSKSGVHVSGKPLRIRVSIRSERVIKQGCLSIQVANYLNTPVLHFRAHDHGALWGRGQGCAFSSVSFPSVG